VRPSPDVCDGDDNDCDGKFDENQAQRTCNVSSGGIKGVCAVGAALCRRGREDCIQVTFPASEVCNGDDDDCDGTTDEGTSTLCYDAEVGCIRNDSGGYDCIPGSTCAAGEKQCSGGAMQTQCVNAVGPRSEVNTVVGELATDEDCDGTVDEMFSCQEGETYGCYTGAAGTETNSPCDAGERTCSGGALGPCVGERTPIVETCANEGTDDDCDGDRDDVPRRGTSCASASGAQGACRQNARWQCMDNQERCVNGGASTEICDGQGVDEDCDGKIDEGFNRQTDEANCGVCGNSCANGLTCCGGTCVSTPSSNSHCGSCGNSCANGLTCCSGSCKNLRGNDASNCGSCGRSCLLGCSNGTCNLL
jgi:Notch 1